MESRKKASAVVARLLNNASDLDSPKFADVITEYFADPLSSVEDTDDEESAIEEDYNKSELQESADLEGKLTTCFSLLTFHCHTTNHPHMQPLVHCQIWCILSASVSPSHSFQSVHYEYYHLCQCFAENLMSVCEFLLFL